MKLSQAFRAVVRATGLLGWLVGFFYVVSAFIGRLAPSYRVRARPWWQYAVAAISLFLIEWVLLRRVDRGVASAGPIRSSDTGSAAKGVGGNRRSTVPEH